MKRFFNLKFIIAALMILTMMIMVIPAAAAEDRPVGQQGKRC